jgi:hypothetical protein
VSLRFELCDRRGTYTGTFVTETERRRVGDVFTTGDRRAGDPCGLRAVSAARQAIVMCYK